MTTQNGPWISAICLSLSLFLLPTTLRADILVGLGSSDSGLRVFADGDKGNAAPSRQLHSLGGGRVFSIAADPLHDELVMADPDFGAIRVFDAYASGSPAEKRQIFGPASTVDGPFSVAVDPVHDELLVLDASSPGYRILTFARTASGDVAPLRTLGGPATTLQGGARTLAVDPQRNEIFVAQDASALTGRVLVFSRTATGNVAPLRTIVGPKTMLNRPFSVIVDAAHDEILVVDVTNGILVFPRSAGGNVAPKRHITSTAFDIPLTIALLDSDEVVVANDHGTTDQGEILVFSRTANGTVAPKRTISGTATQLANPQGLAVIHKPLLLNDNRFEVEATWRTSTAAGGGTPHGLTTDTGTFWYFDEQNLENVVKILNGCGVNQHFWVFAGGLTNVLGSLRVTDLVTGAQRIYDNPQNTAFKPIQDTSAFATCQPGDFEIAEPDLLERTTPVFSCSGLCLNSGRFKVTASWHDANGSGTATGVAVTSDTGYLWFFNSSNVEVLLKVLNGCGVNGHYWVFAGGLTNVQVTLTVHDSQTGLDKVYTNTLNHAFQPIQDVGAFACP
ncbi:MAG: hypothetical protein ABI609_18655 [Acidobacteriota bacterium]